jgi:AraC family transcriptional regulator of adaptative response / DNA-3-methyladenine glycosylase II
MPPSRPSSTGGCASLPPPDGAMRLAYRPPLDIDGLFAFLAARAIPGVEAVTGLEYRRVVPTRSGDAVLRLRPALGEPLAMELVVESATPGEVQALAVAARPLLDLDADPVAIDAVLSADEALRPLVRAHPGVRLPAAFDGFASTLLAILAQGVTLASARTLAGRIARAHGPTVAVGEEALDRRFPDPAVLATADLSAVGLAGRRAATIRAVSRAVADGDLELWAAADPVATLAALRAIPGIGPWTAGYVALRVLGDRDAFPPDDAAVRAAFRRLGLPSDAVSIATRAERWRPWRAYALAHLWSSGSSTAAP